MICIFFSLTNEIKSDIYIFFLKEYHSFPIILRNNERVVFSLSLSLSLIFDYNLQYERNFNITDRNSRNAVIKGKLRNLFVQAI